MTNTLRFRLRVTAVAAFTLLTAAAGFAFTTEEEIDFAEKLATEWRMTDYAGKVLDELEQKNPAAKASIIPARVLVFSMSGKLTNAEAMVKSMPKGEDADAAAIALANAYYRLGQIPKAKEIYADYFKRYAEPPKDPIKLKAFRDACSRFGAMMKAAGEELAAVEAGRRFLKTKPEEEIADAVRCDMAVLLIEGAKKTPAQKDALLQEAEKICDEVLKHGVNLFFGQALVAKANVRLLRGDRKGAQELIKDNMDVLKPLDEFLAESNRLGESPLAGVRMLNGQIYEEDAKAAQAKKDDKNALALYSKAINEYINVFIKYGTSDYGLAAGTKANQIKKILEAAPFRKTIKWTVTPEQEEMMLQQSFRLADQKMRERDFNTAIPEYLKVLKEYPESARSVRALGSLLRCYAESEDKLMVRTTASYIGERFNTKEFAADLIRGLGKFYLDRKDETMFVFVCDTYLENFPKDQNAGSVLFSLASLRVLTNDYVGAKDYLERVVENYTNDAIYPRALGQLAQIYLTESNYVKAASAYQVYADSLPAGMDRVQAHAKEADALRLSGKPDVALKVYGDLIQSLSDKNGGWDASADMASRAKELLERCTFFVGVCYSRMEQNEENRTKALKSFEDFLQKYGSSTNYAPKALAGRGQVFLQMDNFDEAFKVFQELAQKYPNSPEGKNALISLVQSALEIKRIDQARKAFSQMISGNANVQIGQYVQIGQLWQDNQQWPEALQAYQRVVGKTEDKNLLQPTLMGLGKAQFETKAYAESAATLESLLKKFERTPYFFEAKLTLSAAYREIGKFDDAMNAISDILTQPTSSLEQRTQAQFEIALLQERQGAKEKALGSCVRTLDIAILGNEKRSSVLPWIEKCAIEGIRIGLAIGKYDDVITLCDSYAKLFPKGAKLDDVRKAKAEATSKSASVPSTPPPAAPK